MVLTENLKKIMLAGIGTIASTAEKSKEILEEMVKKGEITMDQAKILNGDFAQNLKEKSKNIKEKSLDLKESIRKKIARKYPDNDFSEFLSALDEGQLEALKEQITAFEEAMQAADPEEDLLDEAAEEAAETIEAEESAECEEAAADCSEPCEEAEAEPEEQDETEPEE